MGGYDINAGFSGSSSSTSGAGPVAFGEKNVGGGLKLPAWTPLVLIGGAVIVAVVALVAFVKR